MSRATRQARTPEDIRRAINAKRPTKRDIHRMARALGGVGGANYGAMRNTVLAVGMARAVAALELAQADEARPVPSICEAWSARIDVEAASSERQRA